MNINRLQHSNSALSQGDDSLIPLINVVFLMLIFFMVAGKISQSDPIEITPPTGGYGTQPPEITHLLLLTETGQLYLNQTLLGEVTQALDALDQALLSLKNTQPEQPLTLTLKVDRQLPAQTLSPLLHQLKLSGVPNIRLLTQVEAP